MQLIDAHGHRHLPSEAALVDLAHDLLRATRPLAIALHGPLGAGKTSLARALLRELGHAGPVRSPTYTLVEHYRLDPPLDAGADSPALKPRPSALSPPPSALNLWHLDLYRLGTPEEVDWLGLQDYRAGQDWLLVEWPERGAGHLPPFDLELWLDHAPVGRELRWRAHAAVAAGLLGAGLPGQPGAGQSLTQS